MTETKDSEFEKMKRFLYSGQLSHNQLVDFLEKRPQLKQQLKEYIFKTYRGRK